MSKKVDKKEDKRKKRKEEKKKKNRVLPVLMLLLILVGLVALMNYLGLGFGGGKGTGKDSNAQSVKKTAQKSGGTLSIKVSGSDYYDGEEKLSLKQVEERLEKLEEKELVTVIDDGAIQNTMEALTELLGEKKIDYIVQNQ